VGGAWERMVEGEGKIALPGAINAASPFFYPQDRQGGGGRKVSNHEGGDVVFAGGRKRVKEAQGRTDRRIGKVAPKGTRETRERRERTLHQGSRFF